ncbi:MAG: maleylacetoacetate isomerase [Burkholderiales bacterium]|nr:maleylacetoacetate isomerase [Burkholderiales bacterium]
MKLYTYFRSSAAYRVRIALNLKGLDYEAVPVHLVRGGGEHRQPAYLGLNPAGLVPPLEDQGQVLTQSLAIIEYLEESHPQPALLPAAPLDRARVRAIAQAIACDIHPVNNLRVLQYLTRELDASEEQKNAWYRHWIGVGLQAVEAMLAGDARTGAFCHGDTPGLADCCLVPQIFNARRFDCDLSGLPRTMAVFDACMLLQAFQNAQPSACPDAEA